MNTPRKPSLRWKMDPREPGFRSVFAGPRGSTLALVGPPASKPDRVGVGSVSYHRGDFSPCSGGWYWVAGWGHPSVPHRNSTTDEEVQLYATDKEAKAACEAYVRKCLGMVKP
jgi:hypothetical protein